MAALAPFILGFTKASVVRRGFFPSLLLPNYPVPHPDPSFAANQVQQPPPPTVSAVPPLGPSAQVALGHNPECGWWEDWECYRKYWDDNQYCHPYDRHCYRDCDDYDDYWGHCKSYDQNYGKCYDRCYYNDDNCNKYQDCHEQDDECYRKKRREDYCDPYSYDNKCRDEHEPPKDYCRPWDWACHERKHPHDDYKCQPYKDKDCYPDVPEYPEYPQYPEHPKYPEYPDHPEYPDQPDQPEYPEYPDHPEVPKYPDEGDDDDRPHPEPRHNVVVKFFGAKTGYEMKIWPNGEEHYTGKFMIPQNASRLVHAPGLFAWRSLLRSQA